MEPAVRALIERGVRVLAPDTVYVGEEVDPERISPDGVTIHPGCRVRGAATVLSAGVTLGSEAPMTIENCLLGRGVDLKGGFASDAVFLEGSSMGSGAHVREGTLLEEHASGAHTVGLKQTILFPFVTLGSLINFCDCLMSGGTSRKIHSEVGSSYIHFNFTPDGDKSTASLFGDVAHGVMLDQPPIFLGGQGGSVGPVHVGFGALAAAGSILRKDVAPETLIATGSRRDLVVPHQPHAYKRVEGIVAKNLLYLGNLAALRAWYLHVRRPFFESAPLGELMLEGALDVLATAQRERIARLLAMIAKVPSSHEAAPALTGHLPAACARFAEDIAPPDAALLRTLTETAGTKGYIDHITSLSAGTRAAGSAWLRSIVDRLWTQTTVALPGVAATGCHVFT